MYTWETFRAIRWNTLTVQDATKYEIVVKRFGFDIQEWHLDKNNKCKFCGNQIPITGSLAKGYKQERFQFVV